MPTGEVFTINDAEESKASSVTFHNRSHLQKHFLIHTAHLFPSFFKTKTTAAEAPPVPNTKCFGMMWF
jgi:hypothetical protein